MPNMQHGRRTWHGVLGVMRNAAKEAAEQTILQPHSFGMAVGYPVVKVTSIPRDSTLGTPETTFASA
jgi:hypothetical protein